MNENEALLEEIVKKTAKLGIMGIYFPKEYDGTGAGVLSCVMTVEEMSKVCSIIGVVISAHTPLRCAPIYENGAEEQKKYYLPELCSDEWIGAFSLTESGAGTDAQGQQTTAVLGERGENQILNGSKILITNAGYANVFAIFAIIGVTIDKCSCKKKETSVFIVERTDPDLSMGEYGRKMSIKGSSTCEPIMEGCIIPKGCLLGGQGKGFDTAMEILDGGRIGITSQALGLAEGATGETIKYIKEHIQFGRRISQFQNTQFQLADVYAETEAVKQLVYSTAMKKENHEPYTMDTTTAKLVVAETASDMTHRRVQLFGSYGYTRECLMERMMHDAKTTEIHEGTSKVQRMIIFADLGVN